MEEYTKILIDASTGQQTVVPLTEEEIAQKQAQIAESEQRRLELIAEADQKAAAKESAWNKLAALGLTEEEIKALIG
jgi:hypothetical protein